MPRLSATAVVVSVLAAALLALLVYGIVANGDDKSIDDAVQRGERPAAPGLDRSLPVLGADAKRSLSDYAGKVVVLNFWASWCDPCKAEAPLLQETQRQLEKSGAGTVLGATYDDAIADSLKFERQQKVTYPSLRDVGTGLAQEYGTRALPETFVLDGKGRIVAVSRGQLKREFLRDAVAKAQKGRELMRRLLLIVIVLVTAAPSTALAATTYTDVEDEVMCVSCNVPLNVAESPQADAQRAEIRRLVDSGLSKQEVKDALVEQYGSRVLALPKDDGFGIVVYLVPIAVVLVLIGLVALLLPRWRARGAHDSSPATGPRLSAADSRRLDADLRDFEE